MYRIYELPKSLHKLDPFGFSEIVVSHDHVLGLGSTIALNFQLTDLHENPQVLVHSYHVYDDA